MSKKKTLIHPLFIMMMTICTIGILSCGNDDKVDEGGKLPLTVENLCGTWELTIKNSLFGVYVFRQDGSGEYINIASIQIDGRLSHTFNYRIENDKIKLNILKDFEGNVLNWQKILDVELYSNTLIIKDELGNDTYYRNNNSVYK